MNGALDPTPLLPYFDSESLEQRGDETTSITDESDSNATSVAWCSWCPKEAETIGDRWQKSI